MMKPLILSFIVIFSFAHQTTAQVNDGVYEKKQYISVLYDPINHSGEGNRHIRIGEKNEVKTKEELDSTWKSIYEKYDIDFPEIEDAVLFEPVKNYLNNTNNHFNKFYLQQFYRNDERGKPLNTYTLPNSLRFYVSPGEIESVQGKTSFRLTEYYQPPLEEYIRPFYMSKYEVSNREYKEFTVYVRDSMIRTHLAANGLESYGYYIADRLFLNWDTPINYKDSLLTKFYLSENERFFRRKELNVSLYNYYIPEVDSSIKIYPDTTGWLDVDPDMYNEPMAIMYFWHPSFDNYPVVNINYFQALAFLHWKTKMHQDKLDATGANLKIEYTLPNEIEWDMVTTYTKNALGELMLFPPDYFSNTDESWRTDLQLQTSLNTEIYYSDDLDTSYTKVEYDFILDEFQRNKLSPVKLNPKLSFQSSYIYPSRGIDFTRKIKKEIDSVNRRFSTPSGIMFLGGNVSEWLLDSYKEQWKPVFNMRQEQLQTFRNKDILLLSQIEQYFDSFNHPEGMLIRGSNWYDNRYYNCNNGTNTKCFGNPNKGYPTVGFRYVVHIERK